jgi:mRNA interferase RelE/StbE
MAYGVELAPRAIRQLRLLPEALQDRVLTRLFALEEEPRPSSARPVGQVSDLYRLGLGEVQLLYRVYDDLALVRLLRIQYRPL